MPEEMRVETQELCVTAAEKFATNNESAAKFVREQMDKKFGTGWHVVIGESFDPCVTFDEKSILYMFVGGTGVFNNEKKQSTVKKGEFYRQLLQS